MGAAQFTGTRLRPGLPRGGYTRRPAGGKNFLELLEQHYKEQAAVEFYAAQLHVTPQYLNIACKKETGLTAGHCIRSRIVLEAKRMLTLTAQDVKEIAYELGFSDASYFSRFFRRYGGMPPLTFRRQAQKVP
ncbi:helix-turn-helix domain-containing protein [Chitinophaga sedimenti]|uniref:helix-turn-helix domain-containing protein n=1 Tax=Chitinophaga sedimenti TaxID=2033606 RepID=UPI002005CCB1|nr:helix-turn-helix domain-containing protein [Chitinophaga sedimenti]MCK7553570.1 helix-turn-helix domain-containing protein [Chitinophaga sedimenti]